MISHDVLVVGGGIAGLRAAIAASRERDVAVISEVHPLRSGSVAADDGINAALENEHRGERDSVERHIADTIAAGERLNDPQAVEILCCEAPGAVFDLERWGAPFNRTADGAIAQRGDCPGAFPRTCVAGEHIGHALLNTLFEQATRWGIKVYRERRVLSLAMNDNQCFGVVAMDPATGEMLELGAKAVVLATGGWGRLYKRSANSLRSAGSGIASACQAGASIADMEFVQFHPMAIAQSRALLPERLLVGGGRLLNVAGERFMERNEPEAMERAGSDLVTRAIATEIAEGRAFEDGCVRLDLSDLTARKIASLLGRSRQDVICFAGVDPLEEPIPVAPAQQFSIGGIVTDENGATSIHGLFAAGECACVGAHGSRALAGNPILESVVFGKRAGERAAKVAGKRRPEGADEILGECRRGAEEKVKRLLSNGGGGSPADLRDTLSEIMWEKAGISRSESSLAGAINGIRECRDQLAHVEVAGQSARFNSDLMTAIEVGDMLDIAEAVVLSAQARKESRGSHFRSDHEERDDKNWLKHTVVRLTESGQSVSYAPVSITEFRAERTSW